MASKSKSTPEGLKAAKRISEMFRLVAERLSEIRREAATKK